MRHSHAFERWSRALVAWRLCEARALVLAWATVEAETAWCLAYAAHAHGEASASDLARARCELLRASLRESAARRRAQRVGVLLARRLARLARGGE